MVTAAVGCGEPRLLAVVAEDKQVRWAAWTFAADAAARAWQGLLAQKQVRSHSRTLQRNSVNR